MQVVMDRLRAKLPGLSVRAVSGTIGTRLAAMALTFAAGIVAARVLGPHGRAALAVMISVPGVCSVFGVLGLDNANARFAGLSHTAYRQIVRWSAGYALVAGAALPGAWLAAGRLWPAVMLGLTPTQAVLAGALCPVALLTTLLGTAEVGRGRVMVYNAATGLPTLIYLTAVTVLAASGRLTVTTCFLAAFAGQVVSAIALISMSRDRVHPDGEHLAPRRHLGYAMRAYLPNLAHYGLLRMDIPIIQLLAGTTAVALYAVALPVGEGLLLLPAAVALVLFPDVTSGSVDRDSARSISRAVFAATATLGAVAAFSAPLLMPAIYGQAYRGSVAVIWAMLPGLILFSSGRTLQAYLAATDRLRPVIIATVIGAAVNVSLLLALTPGLGAVGAGVADSAGYVIFTMILAVVAARPARRGRPFASSYLAALGLPGIARRAGLLALVPAAAIAAGYLATASITAVTPLLAIGFSAACLLIPNLGLYVLAITIPFSQTSTGLAIISPRKLLALLVICLLSRTIAGRVTWPRPMSIALTAAVVSYLLASSALLSGAEVSASSHWQGIALTCAPLVLLPFVAGPGPELARVLTVLSFSCAGLAVVEILNSGAALTASAGLSPAASAMAATRQAGTANHNAFGALLVMALAVLMARYTAAGTWLARLPVISGIIVLILGIAYSFSRASYLGAIAVLLLYALRRSIRGLTALVIGLACLLPILPIAITARFSTVLHNGGTDPDSAVRIDLWSAALHMFSAHPLFGVGYLDFASQLPAYFRATGNYNVAFLQFSLLQFAHNSYLTVLSQTGIIGAAGVASLIVLGWRRAWSAARTGDAMGEAAILSMVGVGMCSLFGEVLLVPPLLCTFLLVVLAAPGPTSDQRSQSGMPLGAARSQALELVA